MRVQPIPCRLARLTGLLICFWLVFVSRAVAQDVPDGGAAYDYRHWHCRISGDKFTRTSSGRITIYNERGQEYAELAFYEDSFASLKSVTIKVIDAQGAVLYERDKGDLTKSCGFGRYAIYDDQCNFTGTFQAQQFPYTVEYQYVSEHKTQFFLRGAVFQRKIPVHHASFTLETKNLFDYSYRGYGLAQNLAPRQSADGKSYIWELDSLPALESIDHLPPGSRAVAQLSLTPNRFRFSKYDFEATDWSSLGRSLMQMYRDRYLKNAKDQPTVVAGSEEATAKAIYESVIQDIRYVAIEAGVGGWRPYRASLTLERGFGDCKDMSTLLVSKLRLAGIKADPVFVLTKGKGPIDPDFPGFGFNHVITVAEVGGDTVWMDPTCNNCPFGELPLSDEDIDVLVGTEAGGVIRRTPASRAEDNHQSRETVMYIDGDGGVTFETELKATGNFALWLRRVLPSLDADDTRSIIARIFPGTAKKYRIESHEINNLDSLDLPVVIRIKASLIKPMRKIGGTWYCSPFVLNKLASLELTSLDDREYPLYLHYPELETDRVTIRWDSTLAIDSIGLPQADSLAFPFGEIILRSSATAGQVEIELSRSYLLYQVELEQFDDLSSFRKKLRSVYREHLKLVSSVN